MLIASGFRLNGFNFANRRFLCRFLLTRVLYWLRLHYDYDETE